MADYREIMRLRSLGLNHSQIAESLGASRTTVIHTLQRAAAQGLDWQAAESLNDKEIAVLLFLGGEGVPSYKMPDYGYVHRELMKPGVTQQLLWMEYCDRCRDVGEIPYQLLKLGDQYTPERLEAACIKALEYSPRPSYKTIQLILKSGQDKIAQEVIALPEPSPYGFTRGAEYYGKGDK